MTKKKNNRPKHQKDVSLGDTSEEEFNAINVQGKSCQHVQRGIHFGRVKKSLKSAQNIATCNGCTTEDRDVEELPEVWLCLQCGYRGCGRSSENKHAIQHFKTLHSDCHSLVLSTSSGSVWCYDCDDEISLQSSRVLKQCVEFVMRMVPDSSNQSNISSVNNFVSQQNLQTSVIAEEPSILNTKENGPIEKTKLVKSNNKVSSQKIPIKGLRNLGNTCFFNAVMQNLNQTPLLYYELKKTCTPSHLWEVPELIFLNNEVTEDDNVNLLKLSLPRHLPMTNSLLNFLEQMNEVSSAKVQVINPSPLFGEISRKCPQFRHFQQQDSHELLRQLLDGVRQEEIKRQKKAILRHFNLENVSPENVDDETKKQIKAYGCYTSHTIVEKVFGGLLISTVLCEECKASSQVFEPFMDLSLPLFEEKQQENNEQRYGMLDGGKQDNIKPLRNKKADWDSDENAPGEYVLTKPKNDSSKPSKHQEKKQKQLAKKEKKKAKNNARNRKNSINEPDDRVANCQLNENLEDLNEKDDDQDSEKLSPVDHEGEEVWEVKELFGSDEKISRDGDKDYEYALQQHPTNEYDKNDESTLQHHLTNESDKDGESTLQQHFTNDVDKDYDSTLQQHLTNEGDKVDESAIQRHLTDEGDKDNQSSLQHHLTNEQNNGDSKFEDVRKDNPKEVLQFDKNSGVSVSCTPDTSSVNPEYSSQVGNPDESKESVAAFVKEAPDADMCSENLNEVPDAVAAAAYDQKQNLTEKSENSEHKCEVILENVHNTIEEIENAQNHVIEAKSGRDNMPNEDDSLRTITENFNNTLKITDSNLLNIDDGKIIDSNLLNIDDGKIIDSNLLNIDDGKIIDSSQMNIDISKITDCNQLDIDNNKATDSNQLDIGVSKIADSDQLNIDDRIQTLSLQVKDVRIRRDSDRQENLLNSSESADECESLKTNYTSPKSSIEDSCSLDNYDNWSHSVSEQQTKDWILKTLTTLKPRHHVSPLECSVNSCLSHFTKPELLTGNNKFRCENCTELKIKKTGNKKEVVYSNASKQMLIFSPPAVLTLHLKRFQQVGMSLRKVNRFVEFPLILDLASFCCSACSVLPHMSSVEDEILYSLYGIVEHSGRLTSGHYTAYVKANKRDANGTFECQLPLAQCNLEQLLYKFSGLKKNPVQSTDEKVTEDSQWFYISDSHVREVSETQVLKCQAYLLFYERIK